MGPLVASDWVAEARENFLSWKQTNQQKPKVESLLKLHYVLEWFLCPFVCIWNFLFKKKNHSNRNSAHCF